MMILLTEWEEHARDATLRDAGHGWIVREAARQRQQHGERLHRLIRDAALADEYGIDDGTIAEDEIRARIRAGTA